MLEPAGICTPAKSNAAAFADPASVLGCSMKGVPRSYLSSLLLLSLAFVPLASAAACGINGTTDKIDDTPDAQFNSGGRSAAGKAGATATTPRNDPTLATAGQAGSSDVLPNELDEQPGQPCLTSNALISLVATLLIDQLDKSPDAASRQRRIDACQKAADCKNSGGNLGQQQTQIESLCADIVSNPPDNETGGSGGGPLWGQDKNKPPTWGQDKNKPPG